MKGKILIINPGSTSTKIGFYEDGQQKFETNLTHSAEEIAKYESVMHQGGMRRDAIVNFLSENGSVSSRKKNCLSSTEQKYIGHFGYPYGASRKISLSFIPKTV